MTAVAFVAAAAAATVARALATAGQSPLRIPWRTVAVNVSGAFALGLVTAGGWWHDPVVATAAGLGSFTTFSTVAAEAAALVCNGHKRRAMAYVGVTLVVGIAAAWLGLRIGDTT